METNMLLSEIKGKVPTLILNRPEKRNSLSPDLLLLLHEKLEALTKEDQVRAVIIRGSGEKAFSSGYDIAAIPTNVSPELNKRLKHQNPLEIALSSVAGFPYPTIAMLNGYAFGAGCELAVSCDLRVGADNIRMGMPPAKLGLVYPVSGLLRFMRIVGVSKTKEIFLTARYFDAQRAKELGLVDYLVHSDKLADFTMNLAEEMAGNAPLSIKGTKKIVDMLASRIGVLTEAESREAERIVIEAFNSEDLKEGQIAFLEKRKPEFKGR